MKKFISVIIFILITLFFIIFAREIMVLLHEWSHGFFAWIFSVKKNPFDIHYGGWLLLNVDEDVNYLALYKEGKIWEVAIIAFIPVIVNLLIYLISLWLFSRPSIQSRKFINTFLFWFIVVNLGEVYSYIPIRTFGTHGDIGNFCRVLNISPWIIAIPGTIIVGIATWHMLRFLLPQIYFKNNFKHWQKTLYLILTLVTYFYWYGHSGAYSYGMISNALSSISVTLIPILFILFYPTVSPKTS